MRQQALATLGVVSLFLVGLLSAGVGVCGWQVTTAEAQAVPKGMSGSARTPPTLPGLQTGDAPWFRETVHLAERLQAIGLPALPSEGKALHTHQRLTIAIHGRPTVVPAKIGINEIARFISPVHTHDTTGVIHIEARAVQTFVLGQFFDVWGVRFSSHCIGGYCSTGADSLTVMVNGVRLRTDPRTLALEQGQDIVINFGHATVAPTPRTR